MYHQIAQIKQDNSTHASSFSSFHLASSASWQNETIAETLPQLVATNPSLFLESSLPLVVPLHFLQPLLPLLPLLLPLLPVSQKAQTPPSNNHKQSIIHAPSLNFSSVPFSPDRLQQLAFISVSLFAKTDPSLCPLHGLQPQGLTKSKCVLFPFYEIYAI